MLGGRCSPGNNSAGPKLSMILQYSSCAYRLANLVQLRFNTIPHLFVRAEVVEGLLSRPTVESQLIDDSLLVRLNELVQET